MSGLKRNGTVRKPKKHIDMVKQGFEQLHPAAEAAKDDFKPEVDIILVPGLGAHPQDCWGEKGNFRWPTDSLAKDFPKSRILLYMYESAWQGPLKVKQNMENLANGLLTAIAASRDRQSARRPIVFIGHSMGGLVIAKAVINADFHRKRYPVMFEAIAATIFFGTPFKGSDNASVAHMYAGIAEKLHQATTTNLLEFMKPGNPQLQEVVDQFTNRVRQVTPNIAITCFWEERETSLSNLAKLPGFLGNIPLPSRLGKFVTKESATLEGYDNLGLAADHRNLIKFKSAQEPHFQGVRHWIKDLVNAADSIVNNRMNSMRGIDREMINAIDDALDGNNSPIKAKRKALAATFPPSEWITKEQEYIDWLADSTERNGHGYDTAEPSNYLWVRGHEGRGKTSASMAVIHDYEQREESDQKQNPVRIAYFFCDHSQYSCTAEDILKSFIRQLIKQQEALAPNAKAFIKKSKGDKSQAQITIENLWQALQEMLNDAFIGSKVIFVLNNLHVLPETSASTVKLMSFIRAELLNMNEIGSRKVATRWFITSRDADNIEDALNIDGVRLVDLEDNKYENQVMIDLQRTAKSKVESLVRKKQYSRALAFFVSSFLGKRAQNKQWIEISCVQLFALAPRNDLKVRRVLQTMPQDLKTLLSHSWHQVLRIDNEDSDKITDILRALVLTYEDPTERELGILAGYSSSDDDKKELHRLIKLCKPLLSNRRYGDVSVISFKFGVVKSHLLENAKELLDMSAHDIKLQHGLLAIRCFEHVKEAFDIEIDFEDDSWKPPYTVGGEDDDGLTEDGSDDGGDGGDGGDDYGKSEDLSESGSYCSDEDDYEEEDDDLEITKVCDLAKEYMVKYWLRHASNATFDMAEELSTEHQDFWEPGSYARRRWLIALHRLSDSLDFIYYTSAVKDWTALHVASAVGFQDLVAALIHNGHKNEISERAELEYTPLHLAAACGRKEIVEELLHQGAPINDGIDDNEQTPLHSAAFGGHVDVMNTLLHRGANPRATSKDIGPVVNAAISSGSPEAVQLIVDKDVPLTVDASLDVTPPLALAATLSDFDMFEYLVKRYAARLPAEEYSKAFVESARSGRIDVFNKLLEYHHEHQYFQDALDAAASEQKWEIVQELLRIKNTGLDCSNVFHTAATAFGDEDGLLHVAWNYSPGAISQETVNRALYHASDCEKKSTVELLLGEPYNASPNATGPEYGNALTAAAYDGRVDIIDILLEANADINDPEGWALQTAAAQGHLEIVKDFLKRGANVNAFTKSSYFEAGTALQGACEAGRLDIVQVLFEYGADPDLGSGDYGPPIIGATTFYEEEILELLVEKRAAINIRGGCDNTTPLIEAAKNMYRHTVEMLLDANADINQTDAKGNTALMVACEEDEDDIVRVLLRRGADLLHTNEQGRNALQVAVEYESEACLKVLVERTSAVFEAMRDAMREGNMAVASVVQSVEASMQGLESDDDDRDGADDEPVGSLSYNDVPDREDAGTRDHECQGMPTDEIFHAPNRASYQSNESMNFAAYNANAQVHSGVPIPEAQQRGYPRYPPGHPGHDSSPPPTANRPPIYSSQAGPGDSEMQQSLPPPPLLPNARPSGIVIQDPNQWPGDVPTGLSIPSPPIRRKPAPSARPSYDGLMHSSSDPNTPSLPAPQQYFQQQQHQQQQQQQQTPPPSSSRPFVAYNPHVPPPQNPSLSSPPSYFPGQHTPRSGPPPHIAPKPAEYTTSQGGGGYYSHNSPGAGGGRKTSYTSDITNGRAHSSSPLQQQQQQQQQQQNPAYYPVSQNSYGGWDAEQPQRQQRPQGPPQWNSMLDRVRMTSNEFFRR